MTPTPEGGYAAIPVSDVPQVLQLYASSLRGQRRGRSRKVVAGWEWDGHSPVLMLILAPTGNMFEDIPLNIWRQLQARGE